MEKWRERDGFDGDDAVAGKRNDDKNVSWHLLFVQTSDQLLAEWRSFPADVGRLLAVPRNRISSYISINVINCDWFLQKQMLENEAGYEFVAYCLAQFESVGVRDHTRTVFDTVPARNNVVSLRSQICSGPN